MERELLVHFDTGAPVTGVVSNRWLVGQRVLSRAFRDVDAERTLWKARSWESD